MPTTQTTYYVMDEQFKNEPPLALSGLFRIFERAEICEKYAGRERGKGETIYTGEITPAELAAALAAKPTKDMQIANRVLMAGVIQNAWQYRIR